MTISEAAQQKTCSTCKVTKPLDAFHRQAATPTGRHAWCRECYNAWARQSRSRNYSKEQSRRWQLTARYGLTPRQVAAMLEAQGGVCAICRGPMARMCVDHNHQTGAIRGLLCHACNSKLAPIEDEAYRVAALAYLEAHSSSR